MTTLKRYIDAGTSWTKILEINGDDKQAKIISTKDFAGLNLAYDNATGHMADKTRKYQNEVLSLAYGAKKLLNNPENATIVDIGSRDIKWVKFENGKYRDLDWNGSCGSVTGATVEMLCKFYGVDTAHLPPQDELIPVTCGVFGMEKIMDEIASNVPVNVALAKYIHGIAHNTWIFAKKPRKIYLSGGFCLNNCFIESLKYYCEVETLGRFVLVEGLYRYLTGSRLKR